MRPVPSSVYRLQVGAQLPLAQVRALLPYLHELGVDGIYFSPFYEAASPHGYDITNPNCLLPAFGTEAEYAQFCEALRALNMKQILDVVPNHMGIHKGNQWWCNLLEFGPCSPFTSFFDVDFQPEKRELKNKVLLAILKDSYALSLEQQKIQLAWQEGGFWVQVCDFSLPISPLTYPILLEHPLPISSAGEGYLECLEISKQLSGVQVSYDMQKNGKQRLASLWTQDASVRERISQLLSLYNGKQGDPRSFDALHTLLDRQFYRLAHWIVAGQEINYRRFFNINELVAIHIERREVLDVHHKLIFRLLELKQVQGLRIDHPDGLYNPSAYFLHLRPKTPLLIAEKVLCPFESPPADWRIDGTVGYDFLNLLNGLFVQKKNETRMTRIYERWVGGKPKVKPLLYERKKWYLTLQLASEIHSLGFRLSNLAEKSRSSRDFTRDDLTAAIREVIASLAVYRTYIKPQGPQNTPQNTQDRAQILHAIERARHTTPEIDTSLYDFLRDVLLLQLPHSEEYVDFVLRFQQLTAPVMAKGLEDSCYFLYNRLISLNEVGSDLLRFGVSISEFHRGNLQRQREQPLGFLPSSTHDTKMSEDARYRINVLSEIPDQWEAQLKMWRAHNLKHKTRVANKLFPDPNAEYYLYQMLVALMPPSPDAAFVQRAWRCYEKAIREAGTYTSWRFVNAAYEQSAKQFLLSLLSPTEENLFLPSLVAFTETLRCCAERSSLSAVVLKIASPGIADIYQGMELFTPHLMDPDNRQPVDWALRQQALAECPERRDRHPKLFVTATALRYRREHAALFMHGTYLPLRVQGEKREQVIAWMRLHEQEALIACGTRFFTQGPGTENTFIVLPKRWRQTRWIDLFTQRQVVVDKEGHLATGALFCDLPAAFLTPQN